MASFPIERSSTDAVRRLLRLPSRYAPLEQTSESLDAQQGLSDFEPAEQDLMDAQRDATTTLPSGTFSMPSRDSLRDQNMQKVKKFLKLDTRKHEQERELEAQKQIGLNERARLSSQDGARPYFTPLQTAEGIQSFDTRTGKVAGRLGDFKPGESTQDALTQAQGVQSDIRRLRELANPAVLGPIAGRYKSVEQALLGGDTTTTELYQTAQRLHNTIVYLRTGKQMNESEAGRILAEIPNKNDPPDVFATKLQGIGQYFDQWMTNRSKLAFGRTTGEDITRMTGGDGMTPAPTNPTPGSSRYKVTVR